MPFALMIAIASGDLRKAISAFAASASLVSERGRRRVHDLLLQLGREGPDDIEPRRGQHVEKEEAELGFALRDRLNDFARRGSSP